MAVRKFAKMLIKTKELKEIAPLMQKRRGPLMIKNNATY